MKIKVSKTVEIETDDFSEKELHQAHAYYYQQGLFEVASKLNDVIEGKKNPITFEKTSMDKNEDNK